MDYTIDFSSKYRLKEKNEKEINENLQKKKIINFFFQKGKLILSSPT